MPTERFRPSYGYDETRLEQLKQAVAEAAPEALADGKINWEILQQLLDPYLEEAAAETEGQASEFFGLSWPGKRRARRLAAQPPQGALHPAPGEGVDEATTRNLFIEGENLESLKLLLKAYAGRVKMIYIDPPYNTGNDFVYSDDYAEPLESYLKMTGQADAAGQLLTSNPKTSGRYHSNWLNMIYPRLVLARQLLREDGVIFVSIDDNEVHNLRALLNEVFGEENFVASIVWQKKQSPQNDATNLSDMHDYVLLFARHSKISKNDADGWQRQLLARGDEQNKRYLNPDNDPRGDWASVDYTCNKTADERPNLYYAIGNPNTGKEVWPSRQRVWLFDHTAHVRHVEENRIWWGSGGDNFPRLKRFRAEVQDGIVPTTWWSRDQAGDNQEARRELRRLFSATEDAFETPKPSRLIKRMLTISMEPTQEALVLDFFAGSCTTAQAVLELNREDGGKRQFVMVQLPEPTGNAQLQTIAEIGKERIRRIIQRMRAERKGQLDLQSRETPEDLGFKVYELGRSNFRPWRDIEAGSLASVQRGFDAFETPLVEGWTRQDLLTEALLQEGFPLDSRVERVKGVTGNVVETVAHEWHEHRLWVCLDERVRDETIAALQMGRDDVFICLDSALSDQAKVRLADKGNVKTI
jgi:adenine-specific DNA-methyltransferase